MNNFNMEDLKVAVRSMGFDAEEFSPVQLQKLWEICVRKDGIHIERDMIERVKNS